MTIADRSRVAGIELGDMRPDELHVAASILALSYADNPLMFAFFGDDRDRRLHVNEGIHAFRIGAMDPPPIVARQGSELVGVCGFEPPGGSTASLESQQKFFEYLAASDVLTKAQELLADFARNSPTEPHWHLGPVGVSPEAQGVGIGTLMVEAFCDRVDALGAAASLETDVEKNARLYEKSGFVTQAVAPVIGVPMWFMSRPAGRARS